MPFAVFRQHQRKLLAVFAILAMVGFVLSDTLPRWINSGGMSDRDLEVAELYGKKIHLSDIQTIREQRMRANRFMAIPSGNPNFFGGIGRADLIDALILKHQADRLNIPDSTDFANKWLDKMTDNALTPAIFESFMAQFDNKVDGEQILYDIAGQVRIRIAMEGVALPVVTPLDVFRNFRDQTERNAFKVASFPVQSFVDKVGGPTEGEIRALFERYRDVLPDPASPTPGFKVPRQVRAEILTLDTNKLIAEFKTKLPEDELTSYYETRKKDYSLDRELPVDLFLGAPELTPPRFVPFAEVRGEMAEFLARDKANDRAQEIFAAILDTAIDPFSEKYHKIEDDIAYARKEGFKADDLVLPRPEDLGDVARKYGMSHEITPLMDRGRAEHYGEISRARYGSSKSTDARKFAAAVFDPKIALYDGIELSDPTGDRYLVRRTADSPAHVPSIAEARGQVVDAWKVARARPLARKAADDFAAKVKAAGGRIKESTVDGRPVISVEGETRLKPGMPVPSQTNGQFSFQRGPARATDLPQVPDAGQALIDALFALKAGEVDVQPDLSQSTYYAMTLEGRDPVTYTALMGPGGTLSTYWPETQTEVMRRVFAQGMAQLRVQAGYHPEKYPSDEQNREADHADHADPAE